MNRTLMMIRALVYLLVPYVLLIQFATVNPELHGFLHGDIGVKSQCASQDDPGDSDKDSQSKEHVCAVTLFGGGLIVHFDSIIFHFDECRGEIHPSTCVFCAYSSSVSLPPVRGPPILS